MKIIRLTTPLSRDDVCGLRAGDFVTINGRIITARSKAYARILAGGKLPIDLEGGVVYHTGPIVKKIATVWKIVSAGSTNSSLMDSMQVEFVRQTRARALVGKGGVREDVAEHLSRMGCVYLAFTGGAGVLAAKHIQKVEDVFLEDLGTADAMWLLQVSDFGPMVVAIDTKGKNLYLQRKQKTSRIWP